MEVVVSIDDGREEMMRVAEMLEKYKLKGVFYIAPLESKNTISVKQIQKLSKTFEIGGHTLTHQKLTGIPIEVAQREVTAGKMYLEDIIGKSITKFAYPRGWFNEEVKKIVREAGYKEARTMKMGVVNRTGYDKFELPVSAQNYPRLEYDRDVQEGVLNKFYEATKEKENGYFNLVLHTDEIKKFGRWGLVENILKQIGSFL